jgi:hypothetical protein
MADLRDVLPSLDIRPYSHLLHSLRKNEIMVADLLSMDAIQVAKRCPLPLLDVQRLMADVIAALQVEAKIEKRHQSTSSELLASTAAPATQKRPPIQADLRFVSTLDARIDVALGGGFAVGHVSEVVGER